MKRPRVLFITKWYMNRHDPQLGVFIHKHAAAAALHADVSLLCIVPDARQKNKIEIEESTRDHVNSYIVYYRKRFNKLLDGIAYLSAVRAGLKKIQQTFGEYDITHAYIMCRPALIGWWLKLTRRIPFVISEQWSGYATGTFQKKNPLLKAIYRWTFKRAESVTAVSEFLKKKMIACGFEGNYYITNNIVSVSDEKINSSANQLINILTVADLVDDIKNVSSTIKVVAELSVSNPRIRFDIVGQGKDENKLKHLASEFNILDKHVFFHGVKTNEEVYGYLKHCDFLVMNSRFETFSSICAEALSCGKPVIASRCGGPEEFINESNGILIDPDNNMQLKEAILEMIKQHLKYEPTILKTYAFNRFSVEKIGKQFHEIYLKVLTGR